MGSCAVDSQAVLAGSPWSRYRFRTSGSTDAFSLMRQWLKDCLLCHQVCKHDVVSSGMERVGQFQLPTRVIDVGPNDGPHHPRLVLTNSQCGSWVAMSHCWGNPNLKPPGTTRENLRKHLEQIHMDVLPLSFRDAVAVT